MTEYKNQFTLDGRIRPQLGVTPAKVKAAQALMEKALAGDIVADATLREAVTTSDAMFNVAHLVNLQTIPQLDKVEKEISGLVSTRTVPDFRPVVLQSLYGNLGGPGIGANGEAAVVPEGTPYPRVSIGDVESFYSKLAKRGVSFGFTWEARVNDTLSFFDGLPNELLSLTSDTQYAEIFDALDQATQHLPQVTLPNGDVVPADAPISAEAIWAAKIAIANREVNGRKIGSLSGYNLIVPTGTKEFVEYQIDLWKNAIVITDGARQSRPADASAVANVTVVESDRVTGKQWKLVPKPGATRRPVWEVLKLRGYETPELRVKADTGSYIGGGRIAPFEGSFDADLIDFRYRYVVGSVLWDDSYVVVSDGDGA